MISKEKINKKIVIIVILLLICIAFICVINKSEKNTYAKEFETEKNVQISTAQKVDLDEIIKENSNKIGYREEITVQEEELEYITKYQNSDEIYIGETRVSQEGRNGVQAITTKRVYDENGELIKEEQVSAVVVKSSINKIIQIGTKKYVKPETKKTDNTLDFNIALNKPSGYSLEQFTKALTDDKDKNNIFQDNAKYFYYIEEQYNINGLFVAAVGIHESAWGTSKIANDKNNLFGFTAYDSDPYNSATSFDNYESAINKVAETLSTKYLRTSGTKISEDLVATGTYFIIWIWKYNKQKYEI